MIETPVGSLVAQLDEHIRRSAKVRDISDLLKQYAQGENDWRRFAFGDEAGYTRNLVHDNGEFELLVLCWRPGQASPIHDHEGQRCWMTVLEGLVEERIFHRQEDDAPRLRSGRTQVFEVGDVAFISDEVGLHRIAPVGEAGAITMHLYARPIRRCRIFDPISGDASWKGLSYHTVGGRLGSR